MTTTEILYEMRAQILRWERAPVGSREENEAAEAATRLASELDITLCEDGELPEPWRQSAWRTTANHKAHGEERVVSLDDLIHPDPPDG